MIRKTLFDLTFRLFDSTKEALKLAKLFNEDLTLTTLYQLKDGPGFVFLLNGNIYDTDGNVSRCMRTYTSEEYLNKFFIKVS